MLEFEISDKLDKKLRIIQKKDKVLFSIYRKKMEEIVSHNYETIKTYKNLKSPMNDLKRIHLTSNYILLFKFIAEENCVIFIDILHWNKAYN